MTTLESIKKQHPTGIVYAIVTLSGDVLAVVSAIEKAYKIKDNSDSYLRVFAIGAPFKV